MLLAVVCLAGGFMYDWHFGWQYGLCVVLMLAVKLLAASGLDWYRQRLMGQFSENETRTYRVKRGNYIQRIPVGSLLVGDVISL